MQTSTSAGRRLIWDLPTRVFHWALAGSFLGAYLLAEEDGSRNLHVMFGCTVAGLLVFRLLWGFVGSTHARFRDFAYGPGAAAAYLRDLVRGRARDYDGHNPAGSWAIYALLALAAATALTGWLHYNEIGGEAFEEIHEVLANAWLIVVAVHVAGVVVASLAHRRNLVATMITGRRRGGSAVELDAARSASAPGRESRATGSRWALGSTLAVAVLGFWSWAVTTGGGSLLAGAEGAAGHEQHADLGAGAGPERHEDEDDD
jgi:cytochrome b